MRIQHNIMAMNAYRNYNSNVSAMKSNLEKLSSGYKINRAGDDAAGLAISEKMRAQITGLNAAQKNVKDGISLVQTAEGAMQEVQDMLNRMVYLATQSANGTYDNEVDRNNLQKELDQLRSEIDRISDSANFNGIKLLDGSKETGADASTKIDISSMLPKVGTTLGTDTVLHADPGTATGGTSFSIDFHNVAVKNGHTLTLTIGDTKLEYTATADQSGSDLVDGIVNSATMKVDGTAVAAAGKVTIGGQAFTITKGGDGDDRLVFTQDAAPTSEAEEVDPSMTVKISGASLAKPSAAVVDVQEQAATTIGTAFADGDKITIGGTEYTIAAAADHDNNTYTAAEMTAAKIGELAAKAYNEDEDAEYTAAADATGKITFTAKNAGKVGGDGPSAAPTAIAITMGGGSTGVVTAGAVTEKTAGADVGEGAPTIDSGIVDYNVSTTDQVKVTAAGASRLASTHFQLTEKMVEDGAKIKIGASEYTFGKDVKIDDLDSSASDYLTKVAQRLTDAAGANTTYTVGHDGSRMTFTEIEGQSDYDLKTMEGVEKSFGFTGAATVGKALTFQIGDTADDFNQLKVSIGDIHTDALGIDGISIANQEDAAKAVEKIKTAINTVSSIRGDLGATQNRLEHTANNLSVMTENITDAESSIRDTDVAEEMMSYTKNNILIQAAQAMLAQANQVPQGVLQLLQ